MTAGRRGVSRAPANRSRPSIRRSWHSNRSMSSRRRRLVTYPKFALHICQATTARSRRLSRIQRCLGHSRLYHAQRDVFIMTLPHFGQDGHAIGLTMWTVGLGLGHEILFANLLASAVGVSPREFVRSPSASIWPRHLSEPLLQVLDFFLFRIPLSATSRASFDTERCCLFASLLMLL
jgi:hypothetical protein